MGRGGSAVALVLLAFALASSGAKAAPAPAKPPPPPPRPPQPPAPPRAGPAPVPRVLTGGGESWARSRLDALERAGITGDVALSVLAQWDLETAGGNGEWNFNVGNVKASGNQPRVDLGAAGMFRAFASVDEGVAAYVALLQNARFVPCWNLLHAEPTSDDWIRCLGRNQYYEQDVDVYARGWRSRRDALAKRFRFEAVHGAGELFGFLNALRK